MDKEEEKLLRQLEVLRRFVKEDNSFKLHRRIAEKSLHGVRFPEDKKSKPKEAKKPKGKKN